MEIDNPRVWWRRAVIGLACVPFALFSLVHTMGRSDDYGVLGEWYVMIPLALAIWAAWALIEKAITWAARDGSGKAS